MRVLVACEFSGIVRDAFKALGHEAVSCDLLPGERPGKHFQQDIRQLLAEDNKWDLMIAHPPCTYLCNSGVCHLYKSKKELNIARWNSMLEAVEFFNFLLEQPIPRIVIENPIQHKYARERIKTKYTQIIQPFQFGHPEMKTTCLWLKNLPKLQPTNIVKKVRIITNNGKFVGVVNGRQQSLHRLPPSKDRWKERSRTFQGIADALAAQYGSLN